MDSFLIENGKITRIEIDENSTVLPPLLFAKFCFMFPKLTQYLFVKTWGCFRQSHWWRPILTTR